jgi:dienelactone hydrolase
MDCESFSAHLYQAAQMAQEFACMAEKLGVPMLVPAFPRPEAVYTQALTRAAMVTSVAKLERIDLQLIAMVDDARKSPALKNIPLDAKILIVGFSASGMFANRFTALHPERVKAAAIGSPGGWPIAPVSQWSGKPLRYPVGVADVKELTGQAFDTTAFEAVPLFFFMGNDDDNDSVTHTDSFDPDDRDLVNDTFGFCLLSRWPAAKQIYDSIGSNCTFKLYPDVEHDFTSAMRKDVVSFFRDRMCKANNGSSRKKAP